MNLKSLLASVSLLAFFFSNAQSIENQVAVKPDSVNVTVKKEVFPGTRKSFRNLENFCSGMYSVCGATSTTGRQAANVNKAYFKVDSFKETSMPHQIAFNYEAKAFDTAEVIVSVFTADKVLLSKSNFTLYSSDGFVQNFSGNLPKNEYSGNVIIVVSYKSTMNMVQVLKLTDVSFSNTLAMDMDYYNPLGISPNPSTGGFNVSVRENLSIQNLKIVDMNGRYLDNVEIFGSFVDLSGVNEGVYFLTVVTEIGPFTKKLVIRR